jgi:two-component system chemotaxis response regulator CheB
MSHPTRPSFAPDYILVGASTGGTDALVKFLASMPHNCPPVIVVQHISTAFAKAFADRLSLASGLSLGAIPGDWPLKSRTLYMATGDYHIAMKRVGSSPPRLILSNALPEHSCRPSVDVLFRSAAAADIRGVAVLLTGMGRDGALGLLELKEAGVYTMAQDEASCVVYGMPKEAVRLGAVDISGTIEDLRQEINRQLKLPPSQSYAKAN